MRMLVVLGTVTVMGSGVALASAQADPKVVSRGRSLYMQHCASCHGPDGRGETPVGKALKIRSLLDPRWAADDAPAAIAKAVREGAPGMPAMASKLSAAEIEAVAKATQELAARSAAP